ncbi:MAG: phosphoenolpyruvate synthase [Polyangia bacterium]
MIRTFQQISSSDLSVVGGKGTNLGVLLRAGFPVPPGFCVTTLAFSAFVAGCTQLDLLYDELDALAADDVKAASVVGAKVRSALLSVPLPEQVATACVAAWHEIGSDFAYAVRSSATAEDLPGASFAGQQDTFLNIRGEAALLDAVRRCFVSLFTDRAILYRQKNHFGHRDVRLSVVVQRMVFPDAAGILFTADPLTGHRGTMTIDAGFGLGEALVSGLITADLYRIDKKTGSLKELRIGDKMLAVRALRGGGTATERLSDSLRSMRVLDGKDLRELCALGRRVEAFYGGVPQDIEWCKEGRELFLVQARPVTSLYPLPEPLPSGDAVHVYFGFSHAQNMTAPISPLGRDLWQVMFPVGKRHLSDIPESPTVMVSAGGRLYIDVTSVLKVPALRRIVIGALSAVYPDLATLIEQLADRPEVQAVSPPSMASLRSLISLLGPVPPRLLRELLIGHPEKLRSSLEELIEEKLETFSRELAALPFGLPRLQKLLPLLSEMFEILPNFIPRFGVGMLSLRLLRQRFAGTPHAPDVEALQRGLFGNITTEMDLLVGDLADLARPHRELCDALRRGLPDRAGIESLRTLPGGAAFVLAFESFLTRFGMRGPSEIDVARPRYRDQPSLLISSIVGNLSRSSPPGAHRAHFQRLQAEAEAAGLRLVAASGGGFAARLVAREVRCVRYALGLREHPKYLLVRCLSEFRREVLAVAAELVAEQRLVCVEDVWFLRFQELTELLSNPSVDLQNLIVSRRAEHARFAHLSPPLVMTSEGEVPRLLPPTDLPEGALAGLGASAGVVEGIAKVVLDPSVDILHAGEILVAPFTDPGWTPLFVHAAGLVCDVGGMMTHGSVVAREYGIPAVVGVTSGTRRIRSGQLLRVDGSRGIVEILAD